MGSISKYAYYARSVFTLLSGLDDPARTVGIFLGRPGALPSVVRLRDSGWRFAVRTPMDVWILKETCLDREYLWAVGGLGHDWSIVDVGAGLGDFTVLAAKSCPEGVVHAYEPLPASFALLEENLALNGVSNVQRHEAAVASTPGTLVIASTAVEPVKVRAVPTSGAGRAGTSPAAPGGPTAAVPADGLGVPAVALDVVLDELPGGRCDFLKVDCEGGEYDILMGSAPGTLARVRRISLEYHEGVTPHGGAELAAHLAAHGFHVRRRPSAVHGHLGLIYAERRDR